MGNHTAVRARGRRAFDVARRAFDVARRAFDVARRAEATARQAYEREVALDMAGRGNTAAISDAWRAVAASTQARQAASAALREAADAARRAAGGPLIHLQFATPDAKAALARTLGAENANSRVLARLTGAQPGETVEVRAFSSPTAGRGVGLYRGDMDAHPTDELSEHAVVNLEISRLPAESAARAGLVPGTLVMHVPWVSTGTKSTQSGREIARSVLEAARVGVARVYADAAGPPLNGYYAWAVMGARGYIEQGYIRLIAHQQFGNEVNTVQQVMAEPGGRAWWKRHGKTFAAEMDLTPGGGTRAFLEKVLSGRE